MPTTSHTETLPIPDTSQNKKSTIKTNVKEPKTEVARYRPGTEPTSQKRSAKQNTHNVENRSKVANLEAAESSKQVKLEPKHNRQQIRAKSQSQKSTPTTPVQKSTRNVEQVVAKKQQTSDEFINLQQVVETADVA